MSLFDVLIELFLESLLPTSPRGCALLAVAVGLLAAMALTVRAIFHLF